MKLLISFFLLLNFSFVSAQVPIEKVKTKKEKVSNRALKKSIDIDSSISILKEQFDLMRRAYSNDTEEIKAKLISNNYGLFDSLVKRYSVELNACQFTQDKNLSKCFKSYFKILSKKAYKLEKIDKIQYKSIKLISTYISFEKGKLKLTPPTLSKYRQKRHLSRFLPGLSAYMQNINFFKYKRENNGIDRELKADVLDTINTYYYRKIKKVGRISENEYVFANFNRLQIIEMSKLLDQTVNMMTASSGEILLQHEDYSEIYTQIEAKEKEIDSTIKLITNSKDQEARDYYDRRIKSISEEIIELRKEVSLFDLQDQIKKAKEEKSELYMELVDIENDMDRRRAYSEIQKLDYLIKQKNEEILSKSTRVKLTHGDIYTFTMNWLKVELNNRKSLKDSRSQLYQTNTSFGDLVMAGYITGTMDGEVIKSILELPEMHENYVSPLKQALRLGAQIGRMFLVINPITSPYATLGFVLFDAIKNKKRMEKERANEAHLI